MKIDDDLKTAKTIFTGPQPTTRSEHRRTVDSAIQAEVITTSRRLSPITPLRKLSRGTSYRLAIAATVLLLTATAVSIIRENPTGSTDTDVAAETNITQTSANTSQIGDATVSCGSDFPFIVTLPAGFAGPTQGPLEGFDQASEQLVNHWEAKAMSVELRWPADPQPLYGSEQSASALTTSRTTPENTTIYELYAFDSLDRVLSQPRDPGPGILQLEPSPAPTQLLPGCETMQIRIVTASGEQQVHGFPITNPTEHIDLTPLVARQYPVDELPTTAVSCDPERQVVDTSVTDASQATTPAEALRNYLADDDQLPTSGYIELVDPNKATVYARPFGRGGAYSILLTTTALDNSTWVVSHISNGLCE